MANSIPWTPDGYRERAADRHRDPGYRFSAERLRAARLAAGMSREAVALAIRCAGQSVYLWETGRRLPRFDRIERAVPIRV